MGDNQVNFREKIVCRLKERRLLSDFRELWVSWNRVSAIIHRICVVSGRCQELESSSEGKHSVWLSTCTESGEPEPLFRVISTWNRCVTNRFMRGWIKSEIRVLSDTIPFKNPYGKENRKCIFRPQEQQNGIRNTSENWRTMDRKNTTQIIPTTVSEVKIDNTVFRVKRTFSGEESLADILTGWAVTKTLQEEKATQPQT